MKKDNDGSMTMDEYHAQLKADGKWDEYVAKMKQYEDDHQKLIDKQNLELSPIFIALNSVGVKVNNINDIMAGRVDVKAIPVLLEQLRVDHPVYIKELILRALAVPGARTYWRDFVSIYENNELGLPPETNYCAALILSAAADGSVLDDIIRLIVDKKHGISRMGLLPALVRSKSSKAKMTLLELRGDPDLGNEIKKMRRLDRYLKAEK